jgi:hypothetical protein
VTFDDILAKLRSGKPLLPNEIDFLVIVEREAAAHRSGDKPEGGVSIYGGFYDADQLARPARKRWRLKTSQS